MNHKYIISGGGTGGHIFPAIAIANEIKLDSSYIGQINLCDRHSFVQLPKGMPDKSFAQLKRVRVRRQALEISVSSEAPVITERKRERSDRPRRNNA